MISTKQSFSRHTIRIPDWTLPVTLLVSLSRTVSPRSKGHFSINRVKTAQKHKNSKAEAHSSRSRTWLLATPDRVPRHTQVSATEHRTNSIADNVAVSAGNHRSLQKVERPHVRETQRQDASGKRQRYRNCPDERVIKLARITASL